MNEENQSWVVYLMTMHKSPSGMRAVCGQAEWDAMERARPGYHTLIRAGIPTETEAELLARGTSGDTVPRGVRRPPTGPEGAAGAGHPTPGPAAVGGPGLPPDPVRPDGP
jgi:hypothetical protein